VRAALVLLVVAACAPDGQRIREWVVQGEGGRETVTLPGTPGGALGARQRDYTLSAEVAIDPARRGRTLTLIVPCFHGLLEATVDGAPLEDIGEVGVGEHRFVIAPELHRVDRLTLELRAHVDIWSGAISVAPYLVEGAAGRTTAATLNRYVNIIQLGLVGVLAVLFGGLFLFDRRNTADGAFAVCAVTTIPSVLFVLGWWPRGGIAYAVAGLASSCTCQLALIYAVYLACGLGTPSRRWRQLFAALAVFYLLSPLGVQVQAAVGITAVVTMNAAWIHLAVKLVVLRRNPARRFDATLLLAALVATFLAATTDLGGWALFGGNPFGGFHTFTLAISAFATAQALVLSRRHVLQRGEVERANVELQRQVAARSKELADALGKLARTSQPLDATRTIDDRYRVVRRIGAGGMGSVYEVVRVTDGERLALKTLQGRADPELMARFAREAQIAAALSHANLVPVIDVGVSDGGLYLVMPLVDGGSLEQARPRFGDTKWARPLLAQIASGVAALHERGIVHRDLKPANVLVANGIAKIADFGIAALREHERPQPAVDGLVDTVTAEAGRAGLTRAGDVFGTPAYMAPELAGGVSDVQPASDMFAFGVIAYELLTARKPFAPPAIVARLGGDAIAAPSLHGIDSAIGRCLDLDPAKRPTAVELAAALQ
jgi:serine/threonine-protein kinase